MSNKIWLPANYAGKSIKAPNGDCLSCRNTGAIFEGMRLIAPHCVNGRIVYVKTIEQDWKPCDCHYGQFWRSFHPLNIRAKLTYPGKPWHQTVKDELERQKVEIIRAAGGSYVAHQDSFLSDMAYESTGRLHLENNNTANNPSQSNGRNSAS